METCSLASKKVGIQYQYYKVASTSPDTGSVPLGGSSTVLVQYVGACSLL